MKSNYRMNILDVAKGIAMISVICAHCNTVSDNASKLVSTQSALLNNFSKSGVIVLMVISGFLYHVTNTDKSYLLRKIKSLLLPWIFSGTIIYFYVHLRKPPLSLQELVSFLLGNGSYLYYLTVLCIFYLLFFIPFMRQYNILIVLIIMGTSHTLFMPAVLEDYLSPYLNIFNWIQYFALGLLIQQKVDKTDRIKSRDNNETKMLFRVIILVVYIVSLTIISLLEIRIEYWSGLNPILASIGAVAIYETALFVVNRKCADSFILIGGVHCSSTYGTCQLQALLPRRVTK